MVWTTGFEQHLNLGDDPLENFEVDDSYGGPVTYFDYNKWEHPWLGIAALAIVSLGVRSMRDVYFAIACQAAYWYCGHGGPDAMWNSLAGLQAGRGNYTYLVLPTLLTAYESIENYNEKKSLTYKSSMILGFYGLGYLLTKFRFL